MNERKRVGDIQRSMRSEGSLLFMTFSRMAAFASSSVGGGGGRCGGGRKAFQARLRASLR